MMAVGSLVGLGAGLLAETHLAELLHEVRAADLPALARPAAALLGAAVWAVYPPLRRAMRVDPARELRAG